MTSSLDVDSSSSQEEYDEILKEQTKPPSNRPQHERVQEPLLGDIQDFAGNVLIVSFGAFLSILLSKRLALTRDEIRPFWSLSCLWISSLVAGFIVKQVNLPPLMGMIMAGVIMTNVLDGATLAIPDEWGEIITAAGLAIILIRSGLELDLKVLQKSGLTTLKLTCIPGCVEAIVCGISSSLIFGMPLLLSLSLGFIIAAVSPAVVVVGMLKLQNLGYGVAKGIPSLVVAAASFDDAVAIAGFTIFIGLAIQAKESSIVSALLHGPVSLLLGIGVGSIAGFFLSL